MLDSLGVPTYVYQINADDELVSSSVNYPEFARANGVENAPDDLHLQTSLWDFILGAEVRYLYQLLLERVRTRQHPVTVPFRCDAPDRRRFMEMTIIPMADGGVRFESRVLREELRPPMPLINVRTERRGNLVRMCSMCKKVDAPEVGWLDVEEAAHVLDLLDCEYEPEISHGLCPVCYRLAEESIA